MDPNNNQTTPPPAAPAQPPVTSPSPTPTPPVQDTAQSAPPGEKKPNKLKWILIVLVLILALAIPVGGYLFMSQSNTPEPTPTPAPEPTEQVSACTLEVKLCPDGVTSVGRSGPSCEFEECPVTTPGDETDTPTSTPTGELE